MADSAIGITLGLALGSSWMSSMGKAMNEIGAFGRSLQSLKQMQIALPYVGDDKIAEAKRQVTALNEEVARLKSARAAGDASEGLATKIKVAEQDANAAQIALNSLNKTADKQAIAMERAGLSIDEYKRKATAVAALQNSFKGLAVGVDRFKDSFGKTVSLLRNSTMRIAGLTTAALAFAGSVSKQGNALRLMSERTGIATETLQRLQFAARRAGMESGTLDQVLDKFSVSLGKAAGGSKQQADALARLGIDAKTVAAVPLNKMLAAVADGMKHLTSESERALTAQALFGESGKGMINLLSGGKEGLAALQAQATGKVAFFKSGDIVAAKQFEETFDDVKQTFVALRNAIGIKIFTQLRGSLNQISAWFSANQEKLVTGVSGLINAFAAWLPHIVAAAGAVAKAVVAPDMTYSFQTKLDHFAK